jgi:hypothetical protein
MDKDKTQATHKSALMLQDVTLETLFLVLVMLKTAIDAEPASFHKSQEMTDQSATDQDQLADVAKNTQLMDIAAFHAQLAKSLMSSDNHATKLQNAMDQDKFLVIFPNATNVRPAHQTLFQMIEEEHVSDQSQFAHVLKSTLLMDTPAWNAQLDKSLIQATTRDASQESATKEVKSSQAPTTAGNVRLAHKDTSQTHPEVSALELDQLAAALRSMTQVDMSVSHAHHIKLLPTVTKDVSQDNAQDSTRSSVLKTNATLVENAKLDQHQITSEEDASDTSLLNAHATRDSMNQDSDVLIAHLVLDHQWITEAASALTVMLIKS